MSDGKQTEMQEDSTETQEDSVKEKVLKSEEENIEKQSGFTEKDEYDYYRDERKLYESIILTQSANLDSIFASVSSAAIGICFLLANNDSYNSQRYILYISTFMFALTVITTLFSMVFSEGCYREIISRIDEVQINGRKSQCIGKKESIMGSTVSILNKARVVLFIMAIILISYFVFSNT